MKLCFAGRAFPRKAQSSNALDTEAEQRSKILGKQCVHVASEAVKFVVSIRHRNIHPKMCFASKLYISFRVVHVL